MVVGGWFGLHLLMGDRLWWLATVSVFAHFFFVPLPIFVLLGVLRPGRRFWVPLLGVLCVFGWEYGACFLPHPAALATGETELALLTFNIWGFSESDDTLLTVLDEVDPDVILLQELSPLMADLLLETLADSYPYHHLRPQEGYTGLGIFSRYPLRPLESEHAMDNFVLGVALDLHGREVALYNVHLACSNLFYYAQAGLDVGEQTRRSFAVRESQSDTLLADIAQPRMPAVVAGDFNTTDQSAVYTLLAGELRDAHREAGWGLGNTFPAYGSVYRGVPLLPKMLRLDMVWHTEDFVALESVVLGPAGESDHRPVWARLVLVD